MAAGVMSFVGFAYGHGFLGFLLPPLVVVVHTPLMQVVEVMVEVELFDQSDELFVDGLAAAGEAAAGEAAAGVAAAGVVDPPVAVGVVALAVGAEPVVVDFLPSTHS